MIRTTDPQFKIDGLLLPVTASSIVFSFIIIILLPVYENDLMVCSIVEQTIEISYIVPKTRST